MKEIFFLLAVIFLLLVNCQPIIGQNLAIRSKAEKVTINNKSYNGFTTTVDFPLKEIKKEFKLFGKEFGKYTAKKKYSQLEIRPTSKEENTALELIVIFEEFADKTTISIVLDAMGMTTDERKRYVKLPENTLREFQIYYNQKWIQQKINNLEKEIIKLSNEGQKLKDKIAKLIAKGENEIIINELKSKEEATFVTSSRLIIERENYKIKLAQIK